MGVIKCTNGAEGLNVVREGDVVKFIAHFEKEKKGEMVFKTDSVRRIFGDTGTTEVRDKNGDYVGLISYEPQGSEFLFSHLQMAAGVDSDELLEEVKKVIAVS